jgi:hypothetical protein
VFEECALVGDRLVSLGDLGFVRCRQIGGAQRMDALLRL